MVIATGPIAGRDLLFIDRRAAVSAGANPYLLGELRHADQPFKALGIPGLEHTTRAYLEAASRYAGDISQFDLTDISNHFHFADELRDTAFIFLPGILNVKPSPMLLEAVTRVTGRPVIVLSTAMGHHGVSKRTKDHAVIGRDGHALQTNWLREVPIILNRLAVAANDSRLNLESARRLVFWSHSKGGLLSYTLALLTRNYDPAADNGFFSDTTYELIPELKNLAPTTVRSAMALLRRGHHVTVGAPIEGIPMGQSPLLGLVDRATLRVQPQFALEFVESFFALAGHSPDSLLDGMIETRAHATGDAIPSKPSWMDSLFFRGGRGLLQSGSGILFGGLELGLGDLIVPGYSKIYGGHFVIDDLGLTHWDQLSSLRFLWRFLGATAAVLRTHPEPLARETENASQMSRRKLASDPGGRRVGVQLPPLLITDHAQAAEPRMTIHSHDTKVETLPPPDSAMARHRGPAHKPRFWNHGPLAEVRRAPVLNALF